MDVRVSTLPRGLAVLLAGLLLVGCVAGSYALIRGYFPSGSTDFLPRWKAAELFWREGVNPYDERIGVESQRQIYGRLAAEDEDQLLFAYPFYVIFFVTPLVPFSYPTAAAIFAELMLLGLFAALAMTLDVVRWLPPPPELGLLVLFTVLGYPSFRGLLLGQPALLAYVAHVGVLWAVVRGHDAAAGVLLAVSTVKPQTSFLIVPLLLLWAARVGRWRIAGGFAAGFGLLAGTSFALKPGWLADWLAQVGSYAAYTETYSALYHVIRAVAVPAGAQDAVYWLLAGLSVAALAWYWVGPLARSSAPPFLWAFFLTMAVTVSVSPRTATSFYVELYGVIYVSALILHRRGQRALLLGGGLALLAGSWAVHLLTLSISGGRGWEAPVVYVAFPAAVLVLLFWLRRDWPRLPLAPVAAGRAVPVPERASR